MPEFAPVLQLSSLDGSTGFRLDGEAADDFSGRAVASAGDVNGDGFADLIVGAPLADPNGNNASGSSYVIFGKAGGFASSLNLSLLDGTSGFRLNGETADDESGHSVASAGDVNGDGFDDLIVGAIRADPNGKSSAGSAYVVFGKADGFGSSLDLSALDGTSGFSLDGLKAGDFVGPSASAGDVNGDGFDDVIVGAFGADPNGDLSGSSYVVFGKSGGFSSNTDLATLTGANGFRLDGVAASDRSGGWVSSAGDVNGDGFADLFIAAPTAEPNGVYAAGSAYVVFGRSLSTPVVQLSSLDGTNGFRLDGAAALHNIHPVASLGDVNGDGFDDMILGARGASPNGQISAGSAYVVFGRSAFDETVQLASVDGSNGFRLDGLRMGDRTGASVSGAGDVNGDGFADLLISAHGFDLLSASDAGAAYVVFGRATGFAPVIDLASLDGDDGFRLEGVAAGDYAGVSVASAGDVNGDGFDDLIVGAPRADQNGNSSGSTYVVFGHRAQVAVDRVGTDLDNRINGGIGNDTISGLAGNDTLLGWEGNDTITGGAGADLVDGGDGSDTASYASSASAVNVDLVTGAGTGGDAQGDTLASIENLIGSAFDDTLKGKGGANGLFGGAGNDVLRGRGGPDDLRGGGGNDVLIGGGGGDKLLGGGGADALVGSGGNDILKGGAGNDALRGSGGDDVLNGGGGGDILNGGPGNDALLGGGGGDKLIAGLGKDVLGGGLGADTFVYKSIAHIGIGSSKDVIKDFAPGIDTLDLAKIDADTTVGGNQAFNFIGTNGFSAAGQLRYVSGILAGDVDGDGTADFQLRFANGASLSLDDMLL